MIHNATIQLELDDMICPLCLKSALEDAINLLREDSPATAEGYISEMLNELQQLAEQHKNAHN